MQSDTAAVAVATLVPAPAKTVATLVVTVLVAAVVAVIWGGRRLDMKFRGGNHCGRSFIMKKVKYIFIINDNIRFEI